VPHPGAPVGGATYPFRLHGQGGARDHAPRLAACLGTPTLAELRAHGRDRRPDERAGPRSPISSSWLRPVLTDKTVQAPRRGPAGARAAHYRLRARCALPRGARLFRRRRRARLPACSTRSARRAEEPGTSISFTDSRSRSRWRSPATSRAASSSASTTRIRPDGRGGIIALLLDFAAYLNDARARWRPSREGARAGKGASASWKRWTSRREAGALQTPRRGFGLLVGSVLARHLHAAHAAPPGTGANDYSGENATALLGRRRRGARAVERRREGLGGEPEHAPHRRPHARRTSASTARAASRSAARNAAAPSMETRPRDRAVRVVREPPRLPRGRGEPREGGRPRRAPPLESRRRWSASGDESMPTKRLLAERAFVLLRSGRAAPGDDLRRAPAPPKPELLRT